MGDRSSQSENSLKPQHGQPLPTNIMLAGVGLYHLGLVAGQVHHRRCGICEHAARAAFPPARHARNGLSHHPPGADRYGGDVQPAPDTDQGNYRQAGRTRTRRQWRRIGFGDVHFGYEPDREILHGVSFHIPVGYRHSRWSGHRARASRPSRDCSIAFTTSPAGASPLTDISDVTPNRCVQHRYPAGHRAVQRKHRL